MNNLDLLCVLTVNVFIRQKIFSSFPVRQFSSDLDHHHLLAPSLSNSNAKEFSAIKASESPESQR